LIVLIINAHSTLGVWCQPGDLHLLPAEH